MKLLQTSTLVAFRSQKQVDRSKQMQKNGHVFGYDIKFDTYNGRTEQPPKKAIIPLFNDGIKKETQKIKNGRKISYSEAEKVLLRLGYTASAPKGGSSHISFRKEGKRPITLVRNRKELKIYQMKMIQKALK